MSIYICTHFTSADFFAEILGCMESLVGALQVKQALLLRYSYLLEIDTYLLS